MRGRHFDAQGHTMLPAPDDAGGPPIWVGGNSKRAIRRAIDLGDGWAPMPYPRELGNRRRSAFLENLDDLPRDAGVRGGSTAPRPVPPAGSTSSRCRSSR